MPHPVQVSMPSDTEILIARQLDAPRKLVFECLCKPEFIRRWMLGPPGWTMPVCDIDFRVGGKYRYLWRNAEGYEMGMGGVYREIKPPEKVSATERFEGSEEANMGGETVNTTTLIEKSGTTRMEIHILYSSKAARDGALATGMTEGMGHGFELLDQLLASMSTTQ